MVKKYEIYALKYAGPLKSSGAFVMWNKDWDKIVERNYYIWCIKRQDKTIIVDAGMAPRMAEQFKLPQYINPIDLLSRIDIKADEVKDLIITHLHFDHANGVSLFPNATFYVQQEEYSFWTTNPIAKRPAFKFYLSLKNHLLRRW
jgi:glyoxylase-like metal-dependent hydrolase (beta-lactamase superfamily II)